MIMKSTRGIYNEMACGLDECECVNGCAQQYKVIV